ncbi:hypothetical protein [Bartonella rattaustraliani]|nr:hypothetical protein [Bartonella rattaustraliani]
MVNILGSGKENDGISLLLHTACLRNDRFAVDFRLLVREATARIAQA